ncbi:hypothetical protein V8B97DRAFT_1914117 [Scleroderma yunnanense]
MGGHCPPPLVDLHTPPLIPAPTTSSNSNSDPEMGQLNIQLQVLHGPGVPRTPLLDNPIPSHALHDLTYVWMASAMTNKIIALTGNDQGPWVWFFMAIKDNKVNQHLYNTTASLWPISNEAFYPTPATLALCYYLLGKMDIPPSHPFFGYHCFKCNHLRHWRWEHNECHPYWETRMLAHNIPQQNMKASKSGAAQR